MPRSAGSAFSCTTWWVSSPVLTSGARRARPSQTLGAQTPQGRGGGRPWEGSGLGVPQSPEEVALQRQTGQVSEPPSVPPPFPASPVRL